MAGRVGSRALGEDSEACEKLRPPEEASYQPIDDHVHALPDERKKEERFQISPLAIIP